MTLPFHRTINYISTGLWDAGHWQNLKMPVSQWKFKTCLLTYSQVQNQDAFLHPTTNHLQYVTDALGTPRIYRLGRELHQDGGTHFHVFISWEKRVSFRNERTLDFAGTHPNIKAIPRTPEHAFDYVGKDGDIIHEFGERPGKSGALSSGRDSVWADALHQQCKEEFLSTLRNRAPIDYVLYYNAIERFADRFYAPPEPVYRSPPLTTDLEQPIIDWYNQSGLSTGIRFGRVKSLALWGESLTGKTVWARSLGTYALGAVNPHLTYNCYAYMYRKAVGWRYSHVVTSKSANRVYR